MTTKVDWNDTAKELLMVEVLSRKDDLCTHGKSGTAYDEIAAALSASNSFSTITATCAKQKLVSNRPPPRFHAHLPPPPFTLSPSLSPSLSLSFFLSFFLSFSLELADGHDHEAQET
jgi:hypothetical protein